MILYIIRHGEPIYTNDTLTELGYKQAEALADRFAENGLDKIFSSPNGRARLTAEPTAKRLGLDISIEPWASEDPAWRSMNRRFDDGQTRWAQDAPQTSLRNDDTIGVREEWYKLPPFDGVSTMKEGYERIASSGDEFLERLGYRREGSIYKILRPSGDRVAIFCHAGMGISWISHLLGIPPHIFWAGFTMTHSGVSAFEFANHSGGYTAPKCLFYSDMSHIFRAGLPMKYNGHAGV